MKRIVLSIIIMAVSWQAAGQRPLVMAGASGYMFTPPPTQEAVTINTSIHSGDYGDFKGNAYRPGHAVTVYGVAIVDSKFDLYPYRWVYMLWDRPVDSTGLCYDMDTVATELFCFIERQPVSYADFGFVATAHNPDGDTVIMPYYELYFTDPIEVPAGQRFYVGTSHSGYNVWSHYKKGTSYWPYLYTGEPRFILTRSVGYSEMPDCYADGRDSTWFFDRYFWPGLVDWACDRCTTTSGSVAIDAGRNKYMSHGFFPIIRPPEDSARVIPPHVHPLKAGAVGGLRVAELDSAHAVFRWDTLEPSDWGLVGVNAEAYQVNYAPYTEEYAEGDTLMSRGDSCTLFAAFDSTVMYKARCRARSRHVCDIHDTLVWGDWSREVYFHTGVGVPDTAPVECRRVEGLEYLGLEGGRPRFRWERCTEHGLFDVQYAAIGGDGWHRASGTTLTEYVLNAPLDSSWRYMLRVRAQCSHHCHIHDTVMVGEWSDPVEFSLWTDGIEGMTGEAPLFALRPNPARGQAEVTVAEGAAGVTVLTVADAAGREVLRKELSQGTRRYAFSVADLPAGTYFVTLVTKDGTGTKRLVVEGN